MPGLHIAKEPELNPESSNAVLHARRLAATPRGTPAPDILETCIRETA